ncbi:hypothetical protein GM173_11715 [Deefgea chitinilytica]|uniref:Uncharacterized protein n=2 Tax=Chitinibacteraceae TaxID=2897177 RepID=A0ABS2CDM8_9NEIS|nr:MULTISPECIES: type I restriction-modification system subunit M N-terminal domain-containing protein [Deefgea]MBM5572244.1 hypothetical protein [Deefgea chitinilytica]MBM9889479.1 hypothetical protein [Deefgea sp. CFH1-16]
MDLSKLGESNIKANLKKYIQSFSRDAHEIFDHFKFAEFIGLLNDANLLYKIVQKVRLTEINRDVDQIDLRQTSTVMQYQIITQGATIVGAGLASRHFQELRLCNCQSPLQ